MWHKSQIHFKSNETGFMVMSLQNDRTAWNSKHLFQNMRRCSIDLATHVNKFRNKWLTCGNSDSTPSNLSAMHSSRRDKKSQKHRHNNMQIHIMIINVIWYRQCTQIPVKTYYFPSITISRLNEREKKLPTLHTHTRTHIIITALQHTR